jgi:hypothetical protein
MTNPTNHRHVLDKNDVLKATGIENILNKIIAESFPNLRKKDKTRKEPLHVIL